MIKQMWRKRYSYSSIFGHSIGTIYVVLPKRSFCWRAMINEAAFFYTAETFEIRNGC